MVDTRSLKDSLRYKAQRLREAIRSFAPPLAMSSPPTIAVGAAGAGSTISGVVKCAANDYTKFTVLGTTPIDHPGLVGSLILPGHIKFAPSAGTADRGFHWGGAYYKVVFHTDAPVIEIDLFHVPGGAWRIFVDGQPTTSAATNAQTDYAIRKTKLTFGSATARHIEIEIARMEFGGVGIGPNYSMWKPAIEPLRAIAIGDSYLDYGASYGNSYLESLGPTFMRSLGIADTYLSAIGGEGYLNAPTAFVSGEIPRLHIAHDITPYAPDWIIVALGINDTGQTDLMLQTEVSAYHAALLAANPNAIVTVYGPWRAPGLDPAQSKSDAIKAGVAAQAGAMARKQLLFIDTYEENWHQNAGRIGATSGSGNSNIYIGADNVHPAMEGQEYLRQRMLRGALHHLDQLVA
ncbi:MAG: hypothetical protein JWM58_3661 [Rhizobium sp.]|nr:hypothetical protein [Rhizobium sp.]